jgi:hypothetical protein
MTSERLAELHETVRYALSHGNGQVTLPAGELLGLLPKVPESSRTPTHLELNAKELQDKEAAKKAAEPVAAIAEPAAEVSAPAGTPIVETATLSQEEIDAQVKWDKDHPTQEEQEKAKAEAANPVAVEGAGSDPEKGSRR